MKVKAKVIVKINNQILFGDAVDYSFTREFRGVNRFRGNFIINRIVEGRINILEELINLLRDMFKKEEK